MGSARISKSRLEISETSPCARVGQPPLSPSMSMKSVAGSGLEGAPAMDAQRRWMGLGQLSISMPSGDGTGVSPSSFRTRPLKVRCASRHCRVGPG